MALKERVLAGGRLRILIYVASQLVAWCMALLTIRFLKPEDYGVMAVGAVVIAAGTVIAALGLPIYMVQTPRIRRDLLRRIAGVLVISFVTMAALVAIAAPFAADFLEMPALEPVLFILSACLVVRCVQYRAERLASEGDQVQGGGGARIERHDRERRARPRTRD